MSDAYLNVHEQGPSIPPHMHLTVHIPPRAHVTCGLCGSDFTVLLPSPNISENDEPSAMRCAC